MTKPKTSKERRLAQQRLCKRRRYAEIKNDPELLALEKEKRRAAYLRRKENKKIISIVDKTPRAQREQRKRWKENSKKYRQIKKEYEKKKCYVESVHIEAETGDTANDSKVIDKDPLTHGNCSVYCGVLRKYRYRTQKHLKQLRKNIDILKKKNESQRKCIYYLKKKLQVVTDGEASINDNNKEGVLLKTNDTKDSLVAQARQKKVNDIIDFYNDDMNSTLASGKREYITRNKKRMQKRYLNAHLTELYKRFLSGSNVPVSYSFFCKCRPFWVVYPKIQNRHTCQCITHLNIQLLIDALHNCKILIEKNTEELLSKLCCNSRDANCLKRVCQNCASKQLEYAEFNNENNISISIWKRVHKSVDSPRLQKKIVNVTEKKKILMKPKDAIMKLEDDLIFFFQHCHKIVHQYNAIKNLKENLNISEALVHVDFSENYSLKFFKEVQAMHFGASRQQVSIHTAVIYTHNFSTGSVHATSFCTVSKCLRHDAAAIWAHLDPLIEEVKKMNSFVDTIHFLSDSPSSQYRNKKMFFIIRQLETNHELTRVTWNYSESGHGKGAPDGVGATVKRTADSKVNFGSDVGSFEEFYSSIENLANVKVKKVEEESILKNEKIIPLNLKPFKGTFSVHQVLCDKFVSTMVFRRLSCFLCDINEICMHGYHIGTIISTPVSQKENINPVVVPLHRTPKIRILSNIDVTYLNAPNNKKPTQK